MHETEMMTLGYEYLIKQQRYKVIKQEVPFLSRCIDVVLINQDDKIISIEFKVSKWRHAIEQAVNHKLGADKAYICLPKRRITTALLKALEENGIGLLLFDEQDDEVIREAVPAAYASQNVQVFREMLIANLDKVPC